MCKAFVLLQIFNLHKYPCFTFARFNYTYINIWRSSTKVNICVRLLAKKLIQCMYTQAGSLVPVQRAVTNKSQILYLKILFKKQRFYVHIPKIWIARVCIIIWIKPHTVAAAQYPRRLWHSGKLLPLFCLLSSLCMSVCVCVCITIATICAVIITALCRTLTVYVFVA